MCYVHGGHDDLDADEYRADASKLYLCVCVCVWVHVDMCVFGCVCMICAMGFVGYDDYYADEHRSDASKLYVCVWTVVACVCVCVYVCWGTCVRCMLCVLWDTTILMHTSIVMD